MLQDIEKRLDDLGVELEKVRTRRIESQEELRRLGVLAEAGDQRARNEQAPINKSVNADSTLITSLGREIAQVKRQVDLARAQQAAVARRKHADETAALPKDLLFELTAPDGRKVRIRHSSLESLRKILQPGYVASGQVFGANADDSGGYVASLGPGASTMAGMLMASGEELLAFLEAHGVPVARA
jgi:hypothetical protein